ncbi:TIGR03749 family integrating conjugative element protein [Xenorhabdus griffiniae]|uniref:TIGR03749 family integrating conjugative element protein n=1 Tax=Xenorhabdus griffiniae TaxID=351672 RepID=A0ABY9XF44_9GAMM|nr:TIGR03749 family integrating conjugative element protein [Xenorhabdus griffiniae]MBD1228844.1 TIGR03749 family integrating conjugative element protein [Xenorhabdus griffiniae]MBE8588261.1 TIGR03749 family integrating conjugative element protein [Xenorhabdus griffiniae]WMV71509.1 TIGR03749 family integrating conjugative element protein [Xenorhabdus griffiniae]WNH01186.1 TIGR03749 family integrating conjugative element protein [Xenorhabdus griffiniae]
MRGYLPGCRRIGLGLVSILLFSVGAKADEIMKWERIPLSLSLKVGQERIIFADRNVRIGLPPSLSDTLRVQSAGGAVYLKANHAFPPTRLQLQDSENGEIILLDITASKTGATEPVRLVYPDEKPAASKAQSQSRTELSAPVPVALTRYAAQQLYAPLRTVEPVAGIQPVNLHLPSSITTLYPSEPIAITPLSGWRLHNHTVVALKLRNTAKRTLTLDPRELQGQFVTATFQHRWLGETGSPEDTTVLYLVTKGQPDNAFIPEPASVKPGGRHGG